MIRAKLTTLDGARSGSLIWTEGEAPALEPGSLDAVERAGVLRVMSEPYMVEEPHGAGRLDGGEMTEHLATDSVAAFEYALALLPGAVWVTAKLSPATP